MSLQPRWVNIRRGSVICLLVGSWAMVLGHIIEHRVPRDQASTTISNSQFCYTVRLSCKQIDKAVYTAVTLLQHLHRSRRLLPGEHQPHVPEEFFPHLSSRLVAIDVPDRELRQNLAEATPVRQRHGDAGSQALFPPVQILARHPLVLADDDLLPQGCQTRTRRPWATVLEIERFGGAALEQGKRDDVLHAIVAIRGVRQCPRLVDDQMSGRVRSDRNLRNVPSGIQASRSKRITVDERRFDGRYAVTFHGHDLEKDILNHPRSHGSRQFEFLPAPHCCIKAPSRHGQSCGGFLVGLPLRAARDERPACKHHLLPSPFSV